MSIDEECLFVFFEFVVDKCWLFCVGVVVSFVYRFVGERRYEERKDVERNGDIGVFFG